MWCVSYGLPPKKGERRMSSIVNEISFEDLHDEIIQQDKKSLIDDDINNIAISHNLHPDDDRDEILQIIAEEIFKEKGQWMGKEATYDQDK